jgi:hypothetical protein
MAGLGPSSVRGSLVGDGDAVFSAVTGDAGALVSLIKSAGVIVTSGENDDNGWVDEYGGAITVIENGYKNKMMKIWRKTGDFIPA